VLVTPLRVGWLAGLAWTLLLLLIHLAFAGLLLLLRLKVRVLRLLVGHYAYLGVASRPC